MAVHGVTDVLHQRQRNAWVVIANSGRVTQLARSMNHAPASDSQSFEELVSTAANLTMGVCADGCCGGSEMYETHLEWVQALEFMAASLVEEDAL